MTNTTSQRKVLISAAAGIGLENMDIMFLSFSMASIIATFGMSRVHRLDGLEQLPILACFLAVLFLEC
jgi:hypothetical protein